MKKMILAIAVFLLAGGVTDVLAGSYTITTTAAQDAVLNELATEAGITPTQVIKQSASIHISNVLYARNVAKRDKLLQKLDAGSLPAQVESDLNTIINDHGN